MPSLVRCVGALLVASLPVMASAQSAEDVTAAAMVETAKQFYRVRQLPLDCDTDPMMPDAIIVCGRTRPGPRLTTVAPRPAGPDPMRITLDAPSNGSVGVGVTIRMCFLQKCPKPVYLIDLASIPEAAPGSDADRIAKGEAPAR